MDTTHPLSRGLVFALLLNEMEGLLAFDQTSGKSLRFSTSVSWAADPIMGPVVDFAGPNPAVGFLESGTGEIPDTQFLGAITILVRGLMQTGGNSQGLVAKTGSATTAVPFEFRANNSATPILEFQRSNTTTRSYQGPTVTLNQVQNWAVSSPNGQVDTVPTFYIDGVATSGTTGNTGTGAATGSSATIRVGRRNGGGTQLDGQLSHVYIWNRALTAGEVLQASREPFSVWQPRDQNPWLTLVPPASAVHRRSLSALGTRTGSRQMQRVA